MRSDAFDANFLRAAVSTPSPNRTRNFLSAKTTPDSCGVSDKVNIFKPNDQSLQSGVLNSGYSTIWKSSFCLLDDECKSETSSFVQACLAAGLDPHALAVAASWDPAEECDDRAAEGDAQEPGVGSCSGDSENASDTDSGINDDRADAAMDTPSVQRRTSLIPSPLRSVSYGHRRRASRNATLVHPLQQLLAAVGTPPPSSPLEPPPRVAQAPPRSPGKLAPAFRTTEVGFDSLLHPHMFILVLLSVVEQRIRS